MSVSSLADANTLSQIQNCGRIRCGKPITEEHSGYSITPSRLLEEGTSSASNIWIVKVHNSHGSQKAAEEGNVLKSSILQFRNDVQKQAKRIMQSQESMKSSMVFGQYGANSGSSKQAKPNESSSGRYIAW
jgi:hypothetical protein